MSCAISSNCSRLKLTPFIGDGNSVNHAIVPSASAVSLKLTPFIGDGNKEYKASFIAIYFLSFKTNPVYRGRKLNADPSRTNYGQYV